MGPHAHGPQGDPLTPVAAVAARPASSCVGRCTRRTGCGPGQLGTPARGRRTSTSADTGRRRPGRRPSGLRRAGARHVRRHLHARAPADRQRGGRPRRGAGGLPPGLPGPPALPGRRPVLDVAVPHHRQLRRDPPRQAQPRTATTSSPTTSPSTTADPAPTPVARPTPAALRGTALAGALRELPPTLRAVVVLRDVYDLPHEAIAAELGISESAAKVRLHRARRKLRDDAVPAAGVADDDEEVGPCGVTRSPTAWPPPPTAPAPSTPPHAATSSAACAARPSSSSTASCCAACAALRTEVLEPPAGPAADVLAGLEEAGERRRPRCSRAAGAAYLGGLAAATAAGRRRACSSLGRPRRRSPAPARRSPGRAASGGPVGRFGAVQGAADRAGLVRSLARDGPPRAVAQLVEQRSPKPQVGGSSPSCPAPSHVRPHER